MILNPCRTRGCATSQTTLLAVALLTFMGAGALWSASGKAAKHKAPVLTTQTQTTVPSPIPGNVKARAFAAAGKLPLSFEPNLGQVGTGQADARIAYLAHGSGYGLALAANEALLSLRGSSKDGVPTSAAVRMQLEGAAANPKITAAEPLPGKSNYLYGNDPKRWVRNVPQFARVQYSAVYPGIDLVYYGKQGKLEYDFVVRSGADPRQIRLNVAGAERVSLGADGSLRLKTPVRELRWNKPVVYQEVNGQRREVAGRFELLAKNRVGFALGQYDRSRELIIDPILAYSTYFGGTGDEFNPQVAVDVNSNIYLAGTTSSATGFPICVTTPTLICPALPPPPTLSGAFDVFVSKLDSTGSLVLYTTYLNGLDLAPSGLGNATGVDSSSGLAVDNAGNAYVTGVTTCATPTTCDFPVTTATAFQTMPPQPGAHVFLSKLDPTGSTLLYSSYLAGSNTDTAFALAADNNGNAYVLGSTLSVTDFPIAGAVFQPAAFGATELFFVAKFNTANAVTPAASLVFSSFLGGGTPTINANPASGVSCSVLPCGGIALDTTGNAFVAVGTTFTNIAVNNAFQTTNHGGQDAFVAKIKADGTALLYSTYLGGSGNDVANAIALDSSGSAYITGSTASPDFPAGTTAGFQITNKGGTSDAFVAKLSNPTSGTTVVALTYSSYLGGSGADQGLGIVADANQNAYLTGSTDSPDFPTVPAGGPANLTDAFLVEVNTIQSSTAGLLSSVLLGGSQTDRGTSIAQNTTGAVLVAGDTNSHDFPIGSTISGHPPLQTLLNTTGTGPNTDAFLANFGPITDLSLVVTPPAIVAPSTSSRVAIGNAGTFTYTVTNLGPDVSTGAVLTIPVPATSSGVTVGTFSTTSGSCALTGTTETCTLGTLLLRAVATITIPLTPTLTATGAVPASISMNGLVVAGGSAVDPNTGNNGPAAPVTTAVDYFTLSATPPSQTVVGGNSVTFTASLTPHSSASPVEFPANITPACSIPTEAAGVTCTFNPTPVKTIPNSSSATVTLAINTTKPTTAALWKPPTFWYAMWLPISGLALLGAGSSRRRRWAMSLVLFAILSMVALLPACGKKSTSTTTGGTQPGTYSIGVSATSGTFTTPATTTPLKVVITVTAP